MTRRRYVRLMTRTDLPTLHEDRGPGLTSLIIVTPSYYCGVPTHAASGQEAFSWRDPPSHAHISDLLGAIIAVKSLLPSPSPRSPCHRLTWTTCGCAVGHRAKTASVLACSELGPRVLVLCSCAHLRQRGELQALVLKYIRRAIQPP